MSLFVTAHTTYTSVQLSLKKDHQQLFFVEEETKLASKYYILLLQELLKGGAVALEDLNFIGVYSGPAPFTTLRVSLASLNGLAFATGIPLVSVNGLSCFIEEQKENGYQYIAIALNAFGKDLYVGIYDSVIDTIITEGVMSLELFKKTIQELSGTLKCVGNGARLYYDELRSCSSKLVIPFDNPEICHINSVAKVALDQWIKGVACAQQVVPLYLKNHEAQKRL